MKKEFLDGKVVSMRDALAECRPIWFMSSLGMVSKDTSYKFWQPHGSQFHESSWVIYFC